MVTRELQPKHAAAWGTGRPGMAGPTPAARPRISTFAPHSRSTKGSDSATPRVDETWTRGAVRDPVARPAPGRCTVTAQGSTRTVLHRALERGNIVAAEIVARELGNITLAEALESQR